MTNEKIVISNQCYVGYNMRSNGQDQPESKLAFLTYAPLDDSKSQLNAFTKRQSTVDSWHNRRGYDYIKKQSIENHLKTETIDNELLDGYQIAKQVRRYSGWGTGNVVWRIEDPRGFEFEISSPNMASIMDTCTITNGVIEGKCILGWTKGKVVLLPQNSQPYLDAIITTEAKSHSISMKDVKPGDHIVLSNEEQTSGKYLGRFHYLGWKNLGEGYYSDEGLKLFTPDRTACFILKDKGGLYVSNSLKVSRCEAKNSKRTPEQYAEQIRTMMESDCDVSIATREYRRQIITVSHTKFDVSKAELAITPSETLLTDSCTRDNNSIMFRDERGVLYGCSIYGIYLVVVDRLEQQEYALETHNPYPSYYSSSRRTVAQDISERVFGIKRNAVNGDKLIKDFVNTQPRFEIVVMYDGEQFPSNLRYSQ